MLLGIQFKDEYDKQDLVERAQNAKEAVCDLWEKLAEQMPELQQVQERRYYNRGNALVGGHGYMAGPEGWHGNVGYRNYGMNANGGTYRDGGYPSNDFRDGGYSSMLGGPVMGHGQYRRPMYRENPEWTGPGDRRGY